SPTATDITLVNAILLQNSSPSTSNESSPLSSPPPTPVTPPASTTSQELLDQLHRWTTSDPHHPTRTIQSQPSVSPSPSLSPLPLPLPSFPSSFTAMATAGMPLRGERGAPTFDRDHPSDLRRYFSQLATLFVRHSITNDVQKKQYATQYVDSSLSDSWEALPEFTSAQSTFDDFKNKLFDLYNQTSHRYTISDLYGLIGERKVKGVRSLNDLTDYHLQFSGISKYLVDKGVLSATEQCRAYTQVFSDAVVDKIMQRLQIQLKDHHPSLPYTADELYNAARWILQGAAASSSFPKPSTNIPGIIPISVPASVPTPPPSTSEYVKMEQLDTILSKFAQTIVSAIQAKPSTSPHSTNRTSTQSDGCKFCGSNAHYMRDCALVTEYIAQGKAKRDIEGKLVLPS
ncbi:hypothetical protein CVT24_006609, partial [Panaeolus cyanescens]